MGNIEHRRIKSLFPSSNNLDNPSTKSEDNNPQNSTDYFNSSFNPKKQSLLQLTLSDNAQIQQILSNISLYCKRSQQSLNGVYPSISSLKEYYKVKKQGYCTQQQIFYLIFQGCNCCGLKDQFGVRKLMNKKFTDEEIISILKTYLAGIFIYIKEFKRNIEKVDLDDIGFQIFNPTDLINNNQQNIFINQRQSKRKIRIFFTEPWLKQKRQQQIITVNQVNILLQNPSPQRLKQNSTKHAESFLDKQSKWKNNYQKHNHNQKQFFSLLFSVGVIGLKLLLMTFVDDIYIRLPSKKVNYERIEGHLEKLEMGGKNSNRNVMNGMSYDYSIGRKKLIAGLRILLLSSLPDDRQKIFEFWGIKLDEINFLDQINLDYSDHFQNGRDQPKMLQREQRVTNHQLPNYAITNQIYNSKPVTNHFYGKLYEVQSRQKIQHNNLQIPTNNLMIPNNNVPNQQVVNEIRGNSLNKNQINTNRNYVYKLDQIKPSHVINSNGVYQNSNNADTFIREGNQFQSVHKEEKEILNKDYNIIRQGLQPLNGGNSYQNSEITLKQYQIGNQQQSNFGHSMNNMGQNLNSNHRPYVIQCQKAQLSQKSTQDGSIIYTAQ